MWPEAMILYIDKNYAPQPTKNVLLPVNDIQKDKSTDFANFHAFVNSKNLKKDTNENKGTETRDGIHVEYDHEQSYRIHTPDLDRVNITRDVKNSIISIGKLASQRFRATNTAVRGERCT